MEVKQNKQKTGTPPTVTREKLQLVLDDVKRGSPNKYAAESNRLSEAHFYDIISQGINDIHHGKYDTIHAWFAECLRKIEQDEIIKCKQDIRWGDKSHKGAEWILERCYWRTFSPSGNLIELSKEVEKMRQSLDAEKYEEKLKDLEDAVSKRKES